MRRSVRLYGSRGIGFACLGLIIAAGATLPAQQQIVPGTNVNMVSGTTFPDGDPYLQRQNEPSSAVSTRNPLHILGSANDYRTVDIPHPLDTLRTHLNNADAWLGLFKSLDGGQNWTSTLLPGYPQDPTKAAPLWGYDAATDPVIRPGTNGMFYFAGLAFNRGDNAPSAIFVARFMDMNNLEAGDPIVHLSTGIVDSDTGARFLDKTALATDIPRTAATCTFSVPLGDAANTVVPQTIPAGNVYLAYSAFTGTADAEQSVILFTRSTDCGTTWSTPKALSTGSRLVQNAQIAVDPATGYVYVSWRRFRYLSQDDAVMVIRSTDGGATFGKPVRVAGVQPFDQPTKDTSFRSNGFQTITVDGTGRVYLAWTERGHAPLRPSPIDGDARIVISTSTNGSTWTVPRVIAPDGLGHQLMPALTFHAGRLRLLYYDLREDVSQVFAPFVDEFNILQSNSPVRHTMDVFVAQANPGVAPVFTTARLSDYAFGFAPDSDAPIRLQFNPPNLPLFRQGTAPFMGDYIDLAPAPAFVQNANGSWSYNTAPSTSATSHAFWTDNRDVRPPRDGDWTNYAPPRSAEVGTKSRFDPSVTVPACTPDHDGMRNQNIYTARVTEGLFVSAPGNNKPLGDIQRAFVVVAENATAAIRSFRLTIANQPAGGQASFLQFSPLPTLDVTVPPFSSVARTIFASSTDERARINVSIVEITTPGGVVVAGGLAGTVVLNPDPSLLVPRLQNPRLQNPRLQNPDITAAEAYNAGITNAVFAVPRLQNPRLQNPSIENPRLQNDSLGNPRLQNDAVANPGVVSVGTTSADIENPRLQNPRLQNPRLQNQTLDDANFIDTSWALTNEGNTTAAYTINLVLNEAIPAGFASQLLIHKTTTTPASIECNLAEQLHTVLVANIPDPEFVPFADIENPRLQNPRLQNPTIALAPGESATVTLRIVDPDRFDAVTYDASGAVTPAAVAQSVNTEDVAAGITTPTVAVPMTITTTTLPSAAPGAAYTRSLQTLASLGALTCSVVDGALPPGVGLDPNGTISGTPTTPGNYRFTIRCVDANGHADDQPLFIQIEPPVPAGFDAAWNGADTDWSNPDNWSPRGVPQATDRVYIPVAITVVPTLTRSVTIRDLVVEPGAKVDTNGFTLTVTHNADAGRTIVGTGTTILTGDGATAAGVFSNLEIRGRVTLNGPVTATGRLTLTAGARLILNGQSLIVGGQLVTNVITGAPPVISGPASSLIVAGVLVNGLVLDNAPLTVDGSSGTAALSQFDNVRFGAFAPEAVQLTISHPGLTTHFAIAGASFTTTPTTGRLLQVNDTNDGANTLIVDVVRAVPADGTAATGTNGGAVVNWISDPGDANLAVTQAVSPIPAVAGTPLTYTITVTNGGPGAAVGVTLNADVPAGATGVTSSTTQGSCAGGAAVLTCSLGTLPAGSQAVVTVSFVPPAVGTLITTATVSSTSQDISQGNNAHTIAATVVAAGAGVSLTLAKTGPAGAAAIGTPFAYGLTVTNAGLTTATAVTVIDPIPAGLTISDATPSRGTCSIAAGQVVCSLGTLGGGETATIALSATASAAGLITNAASVTSDGLELTPADNVAVVQTMVLATAACSVPTFTGPISYPGSPGPTAVVRLVDMDHDGDLDVVATHEINGGGVDVMLNDGTGHFGAPRFTSTITGPWVHVVADFNGDTHPDVISSSDGTNGNPPTLRLLTNDGTGGLALVPTFSVPFGGWLEAVDIDRDGDQDVVFVTPEQDVSLLRNDGAGNFAAPVTIVAGQAGFFGLGDYNGDNRTDLIVTLGAAGYGVVLADATGGFLAPVVHAVPGGVNAGTVADLNGDGHLDLLLIAGDQQEPSGQASVVLGDGAGGFGAPIEVPAGSSFIYFPALSDVNGDGNVDLLTISGLNGFEVRLGDGAGGFSAAVQFANATYYGPTVGDVNGDGRPDIVTGDRSGQLNVFLNNCGAPPANLAVAVGESGDPVNEGDELTYTVTLTNHADTAATGVRVRSVLTGLRSGEPEEPNAAAVAATSSAEGATLTTAGSTFTWLLPTVAAHGTATFEFRFRTLAGGQLYFTTGATSDGAETDSSDNTATATTTVNAAGRTITVTNTNNSGPGSLRQALIESNGDGDDVDRIVFNIGAGGPQTITVLSALPDVEQPAVVDGTTQPGFSGTPIIELNGNGLAGANGLSISGGNTIVRGLVINRFGQNGIALFNGGGNIIEGNYIGVDVAGGAARPNGQQGVLILSGNNRLGGPAPPARNIISGNAGNGVSIVGAPATGNIVQGSYVGTNASGTAAVPNLGAEGILVIDASGNSILGNVVSGNASHGVQIFGAASVATIVQGNFVGTNPTGTSRIANAFVGVQVWSARNTVIGGPGSARNIISGNGTGIELRTGATGTRVENNYIGINAAGAAAIANAVGITINDGAVNNSIGRTVAGTGNIISGNTGTGVTITGTTTIGNSVQGNSIFGNGALGIDLGGNGVTANDSGDPDAGPNGLQNFPVLSSTPGGVQGTLNSTAGTTFRIEFFSNTTCDASGNGEGGTFLGAQSVTTDDAGNATIPFFTAPAAVVTATATGPTGNTSEFSQCVTVSAGPQTYVVANTNDSGPGSLRQAILDANADIATRDTIAFNIPGAGVHTISPLSPLPFLNGPVVLDGTTQPGFAGLPLIELDGTSAGASANGLSVGATGSVIRGLIINRFGTGGPSTGGVGILVVGEGNHSIQGNFVGTDASGAIARPNRLDGISIGSGANLIGGTTPSARNVVSGNGRNGIEISGSAATGNIIQGNYVGIDAAGSSDVGNAANGIEIASAPGNQIGGTSAGARNIISGNETDGIALSGSPTLAGNVIQGNYIGTDASGTARLGNTLEGIIIFGSNNTIGGTAAGAGNVIAANRFGLWVNTGGNNLIQGNFVGTNTASATGLGNVQTGMLVFGTAHTVGGTAPGAGNVIVSNGGDGLRIAGSASIGTVVQGNFIGTNPAGATGLGNNGPGIWIFNAATNHTIGGSAAGARNVIARNTQAGINIADPTTTGIIMRGNSIHDNGGLGIDLAGNFAINLNDPGDADTGANGLQNFPVVTSALVSGGVVTAAGTINSTPNTTFRIEFFSNSACDPSGNGEGATFVAGTDVTTDAAGNAAFSTPVGESAIVTATATGPTGTSEFSTCRPATTAVADLGITQTDSADPAVINTPFTYTLTVQNAGPNSAPGVVATDTLPADVVATQAQSTVGTCTISVGQVSCVIGTLAPAQTAVVTITVATPTAGLITNTASVVTAGASDPNTANNTAVEQTMVLAAAACSVPTFTGPVSYQGSPGSTAMVKLVDMDHDGDLDVVAAHETQSGGIDVMLNDGSGGFSAPRSTSAVTRPWVFAVGDFNGDTHPDVLSASDSTNGNPPALRLLTNDGAGTLTLVPTFSVPFGGWLETVDIDRDGDQDVVFVTALDNVALLRNDGAAGLAAPVTIFSGTGGFFGLGDYNGDSRTDAIVPLGASGFGVALADTTGGFLPPVVHAVPGGVNFGSAADLNGDGHLDLLLIAGDQQEPSGQTSVVLGDGAGGFGAPADVAVGSFIYFPTLTDVNGDGKIDLAAINGLNGIEVRLGDGAGGFSAGVQFPNANGFGPAVGDVNGDGRPDLVSPDRSGQINVFVNNCGAPAASLGVAVSESADPVNEGDELTYTVTVTNHANTAATGVRLRSVAASPIDDDPDGPNVDVVSITSSAAGATLATASPVFTWAVPTVAANSTATFQFRLRALGGDLIFSAGVTSDGAETDPFDNGASETTTVVSTGRTLTVTNTNDSGPGSLRQALIESNLDTNDVDHIAFNIGTGGPQTITVLRELPDVETPAIIDGTTQPGFSGTPIIELNGNGLAATNGLFISGGNTTVRGLVINRFGQNGIALLNGGGNVIEGNYIGVDLAGAAARANAVNGVLVFSANNRIGGPTAAQRNVISGNTQAGVFIGNATATGNLVEGNYIGLNAAGTAALSNQGFQTGIVVNNAPANTLSGNVISGHAQRAIGIDGTASNGNIVRGNFIGTDPTGATRLANGGAGIDIVSARNTIIGGPGVARNVISGNGFGIQIRTGATGTRVENNYVGINAAGTAAISNSIGININDSANANTIGGITAGAGNVISGNTSSGVSLSGGARSNVIQGNRVGTNANGTGAVPNGIGVLVDAPSTTVGGTNPLARNVLSGNSGYGVSFIANALESVAQGNYIGTNIAGTGAIPNGLSGVNLGNALSVTIGGTAAGAGNVISGNATNGIIVNGSFGDLIQGNFIGTTATGGAALPNGNHGVSIGSSDGITVGGTAAGARNVISGNTFEGVSIGTGTQGNIVQGNLIGTDSSGTVAIGNRRGIQSASGNTTIGGTTAAARNIISGNAIEGVLLSGLNDQTTVQGNFIGTGITGTTSIPNLSHGVSLSGTVTARVGGTQAGAGNVIRNNGGAGVAVIGATARDNAIQGNSISGNSGLGIDLNANGVTANDAGDTDDGPNHLQNFPVLNSALEIDSVMTVQGSLNSTPNTTFRIEFFSSAACDALGNGEGNQFLGATDVTTNASGNVTFSANPTLGTLITATATDPNGNTSEFSNCRVVVEGPADASISIAESADPVVVGTPFNYVLTMQNAGPNVARAVSVVDTLPAGVVATAAQTTRGTCTIGAGQVTCNLGNVPLGQNAVITITVVPSTAGLITNSAIVEIAQVDQNAANDTDSEQTLVQATAACAAPTFSGPTMLFAGTGAPNATDLLMGDLNGDGVRDLVAPLATSDSIAIYLGNATGGFGAATLIPGGTGPLEGDLADLNGDGTLDLALEGRSEALVLFGNGGGGFGAPTVFGFADETVSDVRTGDFNGDGSRDLVIASGNGGTTSILRVLLNNGQGVFTAQASLVLDRVADRLVVRDVNGDGRTDVVASFFNAGTVLVDDAVYVLLGSGQGTLAAPTSIPIATQTTRSFVHDLGDLNGDGFVDLGLVQFAGTGRRLVLLFGNGAGGFTQAPLANAPPRVFRVTSADLNDDGRLDLVSGDSNRIGIQFANGPGTFADPVYFAAMAPGDLRIADFNGDGQLDIAAAIFRVGAGGVSVFLNACGQPETNLQVSVTDSPDPVLEGQVLAQTTTVTNAGPIAATNVNLLSLVGGVSGHVQSISTSQGSCANVIEQATCSLGTLASGASATVTLELVPHAGGVATLTAGVTSDQADSDPNDNTDVEQTVVTPAGTTLVVSNTNNTGPGSLRQAINDSNADAGDVDQIHFNIPGTAPFAITLATALPNLLQPVVVDATTQPGYAGTPLVQLVGNATAFNGLSVAAGNTTIRGLSITGFPGNGIHIAGPGANVIEANHVGVDPSGTLARGNGNSGIAVNGSSNNRIGGTLPAQQNVVSANGSAGVSVTGATSTGNLIQGNRIGTNRAGTGDLGNGQHGVLIFAGSNNTIGGNSASAGNLISGNLYGVSVHIGAGNAILNNLIGVSANGMTALPNDTHAINVNENATGTLIGGNVLSGNLGSGVILNNGSSGSILQGNRIGTAIDGVTLVPNQAQGVIIIDSASNSIGGTAAGATNVIAGNGSHGVAVQGATSMGNAILSNSIFSNGALGIELNADGPTPNDLNDVDAGANGSQNFPVLSNAVLTSTQLAFQVDLNSVEGRPHTLEFFRNSSCDSSGFGEGQALIAVSTFGPVVQNLRYSVTVPAGLVTAGDFITATATSSDGTSEFSACLQVPAMAGEIGLALADATVVGVGRQAMLEITLPTPAPAGGVTVTVATGNSSVLAVAAPGTVAFAPGSTLGQIALTGVQAGTTNATATASGYADGTLSVLVTENLISTPASLTVPFGQSRALPVNIGPSPAPPGGLTLDVVSSDPANVEVLTPVVTVPEGAFSANGSIRGNRIGGASVTVSNPDFSPSTTNVASTAELNILLTSVTFNDGLPPPVLTLRLESGGTPTAAQPALTTQLTSANPACVTVPATATIAAGLVSTTFTPAFGGAAPLPCTTTVTASSADVLSDSISITVIPMAGIFTSSSMVVGAGLMVSTGASLGSVQHGGVTVTITSSDPARVLISGNAETAGAASVTLSVPDGQSFVPYVLQGVENTTGTASITVAAPGFTSASHDTAVVPPGLEIYGLDPSTTLLSLDDTDWYVQVGIPSSDGAFLTQVQSVRPGPPLVVTLTNSDDAVAVLRSDEPAATGQSVTKPIQPGWYYTQSVAPGTAWGLGFEALTNGTTSVAVSGPAGVRTMSATGVREVQVVGGSIAPPGTVTVGSGLMTFAFATLSASGHGGIDVTVTSDDPSRVLVSADTATVGQSSITIAVPNGQSSVPYYLHALENATGSATVTIATRESEFGTTSHSVDVVPPGVEIYGLDATMSLLSGEDSDMYAQVGIPNGDGSFLSQVQVVRTGFPLVLTFTNGQAAVGRLRSDQPAAVGQSVTKPIQPGAYFTLPETTGTSWGLAFEPLANGTTTVTVSGPPGVRTMSATGVREVTVANASITAPGTVVVGSRLMTFTGAQLSAANHGGVDVTVTSSDPAKLRLSPDGIAEGTASLSIPVPDGQTFIPYYPLGVADAAGTVTVTISAPGFGDASHQVNVVASGVEIYGLDAEMSNLSPDDVDWYVQIGIPNTTGTSLAQVQLVQPGPPLVVTLNNSQATVGRLHSDEPVATGQSVTKPIQPGTYFTIASQPGSFFGLGFEPLSNGATTVTAVGPAGVQTMSVTGIRPVNVSTPRIIVSAAETVGAGLQAPVFATLNASQHGGVSVSITSSAPGLVRVSPDATTTGEASFSYTVPNGDTGVPFFIQGMENASGTAVVTLSAPGFETASMTVTVTQSGIEIQGLPLVTTAGADEEVNWYVLTGIPNAQGSALTVAQPLRAGAPPFVVTLTASNALARLHSDEPFAVGQTVTKPILPGSYYTQSAAPGTTFGLGFKALAAGSVVVSVTGPPGVSVTDQGSRTVTINP